MSRIAVLIASFAALLVHAVPAFAQDLPDLGGRTVAVVTENAFPPLQFIDPKSGQAAGWEYDAMSEIAKRLNISIVYHQVDWDELIQSVADKRYDMGMAGITIRDDRMGKVDFSDAYMRSEMFLLVRAGESRFFDARSLADFAAGRIGALAGTLPFYTAVYQVLDGDEANPRIKLFETFEASVKALMDEEIDAVLTDGPAARAYAEASGGKLQRIGPPIAAEDFGFIFPKGSDLVGPFDAAIAALKADGTLGLLTQRWFVDHKKGR